MFELLRARTACCAKALRSKHRRKTPVIGVLHPLRGLSHCVNVCALVFCWLADCRCVPTLPCQEYEAAAEACAKKGETPYVDLP
jgi:hypothetical protein